MEKIKVGVVFGGRSSEYPVSLHSTASFLKAIDTDKYEPVLIGIDREGDFFLTRANADEIEKDLWKEKSIPALFKKGGLATEEGFQPIDVVFPVLHGKNGEDGTFQGMLELYQIPYVGCDAVSSANCMDKELTHRLLEQAGLPMAEYQVIHEDEKFRPEEIEIELPWIVKPCNAGSSFGVSFVDSLDKADEAVAEAFKYDGKGKALIEKAIDGFEIGCAVLGERSDLKTGEIDEIETSQSFFDYEGKYDLKDSAIYCPARIDKKLSDQAKELAREAYQAMNCSGFARVDMFVDKNGELLINEINTIPGLTEHSRYPSMMAQAGLSFTDLISDLIERSKTRKVGAW